MRTLIIVAVDEVVELGLLLQEVFASRLGGLQLKRQMHAFMAAVLLWVARLYALDLDAQPEPPHGQFGQIEEGIGTGKRNAVIGADGFGQAELLENSLKHRKRIGLLGSGERLAGEEIAASEVSDRERIAIAAVREHELALVVGAPQLIGLSGKGKGGSL